MGSGLVICDMCYTSESRVSGEGWKGVDLGVSGNIVRIRKHNPV